MVNLSGEITPINLDVNAINQCPVKTKRIPYLIKQETGDCPCVIVSDLFLLFFMTFLSAEK